MKKHETMKEVMKNGRKGRKKRKVPGGGVMERK